MKHLSMRHLAVWLLVFALAPLTAQTRPQGYEQDVRAYNLAHGRVVFTEHCMRCHETGRTGAPVLGDPEDWAARLDKPLSTLITNAQEGHGEMPSKGDLELTDQDVASAVAYVAHHSRRVLANELNALPATATGALDPVLLPEPSACSDPEPPAACGMEGPAYDMVFSMFIMLIGQERWK